MSDYSNETDDYDLKVIGQTDAAWQVETDKGHRFYLPKGKVDLNGSFVMNAVMTVTVPNWLAEDRGLI
jgi:hypothetical protein